LNEKAAQSETEASIKKANIQKGVTEKANATVDFLEKLPIIIIGGDNNSELM
jgi:hypothetical protein